MTAERELSPRRQTRAEPPDPKMGPRLGARQQPAAVCAVGWIGGSGGLVAALRGGAGDSAKGDFEAEGAEFADVVGDLPAGVTLALVVVGAEVFIPGAGARQQRVVDLQLGVADGDACFGVAAAAGQPPAILPVAELAPSPESVVFHPGYGDSLSRNDHVSGTRGVHFAAREEPALLATDITLPGPSATPLAGRCRNLNA
jgi:hypothetical protein